MQKMGKIDKRITPDNTYYVHVMSYVDLAESL